jgi:class 3 adenylate cyclase
MITDERGATDGDDPEAVWRRIGAILDGDSIEESETLPARLHGPGAVVRGTVLFVDVRESHDLARSYPPAHLARLYRALVSELITILTDPLVRHVGTTGDRVWAIYDTPTGADAATVLGLAGRANTLRWLINRRLQQGNETAMIAYGIGIEYGRLIMINTDRDATATGGNVAYAGDTMHRAAELAHHAGRTDRLPVDVGSGFAAQLDDSGRRALDEEFRPDPDDQGWNGNPVDGELYQAGGPGEHDSGPA